MKPYKADILMGVITLIWGFTFVFTKLGLESTNGSFLVFLRFSIGMIFLLIFYGKHLFPMDKQTFMRGLVLGLLYGGGFVLQTYGLQFTTVPKSAFITGMAVPMVPFVFWMIVRKRIQKFSIIGVGIATLGLWLFSRPDFNNLNLGDILTLFSTLFWAFYVTLMDVYTKDRTEFSFTVQLVFLQFLFICFVSSITFFIFDYDNFFFIIDSKLISAIAYNGIIASFFVTFIHTGYQKFTTPVKAALIFSLEPVVASIAAIFFFSIHFHWVEILGAMIMIIGVLTSELGPYIFKSRRTILNNQELM
jgi:drug/metabolite transporter (DMT)-like permease